MPDIAFVTALSDSLIRTSYNAYSDNIDPYRFPEAFQGSRRGVRRRFKNAILKLARHAGFVRVTAQESESISQSMSEVLCRVEGLGELYRSLGDEESRRVLIAVLAFWCLGSHKVKLPLNQTRYWATARHIDQDLLREQHTFPIGLLDGYLNLYDLGPEGFPLRIHAHRLNILNTFILQQYRYAKGGKSVEAKPGDIVIDGGGCWGDTALYFSHLVQPNGAVICFEFSSDNLEILRANLEINPNLKTCVSLVDKALWDRSEEGLSFHGAGPATSVAQGRQQGEFSVGTLSIDDLVAQNGMDRVDLIKLDIEGAELRTLKGAQHTLNRFRPLLAISLYHSLDDFVAIPAFLMDLDFTYELYLDHFTIHREETVLFAQPTAG